MAVRVETLLVIHGGALSHPWVPSDVSDVHGKKFMPLRTSESSLHKLMGSSRKPIPLLDILRDMRNKVVDDIILEHMRADNPMGVYESLPKTAPRQWRSSMPKIITLHLPLISNAWCLDLMELEMRVLPNTVRLSSVEMEITSENLEYLCKASRALEGSFLDTAALFTCAPQFRKKRCRDDKVELCGKRVKVDYRRFSLRGKYCDADGRVRTRYLKPTSWTNESIREAEKNLSSWLYDHHHDVNEDGEHVLARNMSGGQEGYGSDGASDEA
jgi:hypothetical protein